MSAAHQSAVARHLPNVLRWVGLLIILCIAALRMVTAFSHTRVFDIDPAFDPTLFAGLANESLWLDALLLGGAGLALLGYCLAGRGLHWMLLVAALAPMIVVFVHGFEDLGDLRKGATWSAAAIAGITIAHLRNDPAMRVVIIMVVVGVLGPLLLRGAANVTYEYEDTLAHYEQHKNMILADKGWTEDSSSARIYRRRLEQRQPTGWFTTTNIFGSFMGAGVALWLGLGLASLRAKLTSGWTGLCVLFAGACAGGLWMTTSKGALLSCLAGLGALAVLYVSAVRHGAIPKLIVKLAPLMVVGLVVAAIVGIVVRGAILPESFAGEVSLLYRWHYMVSAVQIFMENALLGVGPDEFQAEYMMHRVARNPEEVASAHSIFFDWLATLGIVSVAWIGLVLAMLWRAGRHCDPHDMERGDSDAQRVGLVAALGATLCVAVFGIAIAMLWERHILDALGGTVRVFGVMGFVVMAMVAGHIATHTSKRIVDIAVLAAAIVLVVHGQIEMTWMQPGSVVMAWVMLGAASAQIGRTARRFEVVLPIVVLCAAVWLANTGAIPAMRLQHRLVDAAQLLWPAAEARQAQLVIESQRQQPAPGDTQMYVQQRNVALEKLGIEAQAESLRWPALEVLLKPVLVQRRLQAAEILEDAYLQWPVSEDGLSLASRQLGLASRDISLPQRIDVLLRSTTLAEQSAAAHNDVASAALAILMRLKLHELTGDEQHIAVAIDLAKYLTTRDPKGIRAWVSLGNVLWEAGARVRAADAYRNALQHSDNFELDPLKQLDVDDRALLTSRIAEAVSGE